MKLTCYFGMSCHLSTCGLHNLKVTVLISVVFFDQKAKWLVALIRGKWTKSTGHRKFVFNQWDKKIKMDGMIWIYRKHYSLAARPHSSPCFPNPVPGRLNVKNEELDAMMKEASGPINFTVFLTMFGEKLKGEWSMTCPWSNPSAASPQNFQGLTH